MRRRKPRPRGPERNLFTQAHDALAAAVVIGWSLDDEFTHGNLTELLKQYKGLSTYIAKHFQESRKALLEK